MNNQVGRKAEAWQRGGEIFLHASSKTKVGVWIMTGPVIAITQPDPIELGKAILSVLENSKEGVPHPTVWTGFFNPVLKLAKAKSWNTFAKSAKNVGVAFNAGHIYMCPTRYLGESHSFEDIKTKTRKALLSPESIGAALLASFADCE